MIGLIEKPWAKYERLLKFCGFFQYFPEFLRLSTGAVSMGFHVCAVKSYGGKAFNRKYAGIGKDG